MSSESGSPSDAASFDQGVVRLLTDHVSAILWTTDPSLRITWITGGGLATFGVKPGDGVGKTLYEYFRTEDRKYPPIAAHLGALEGRCGDYEVEYQGRTFYSRVEPFRAGNGVVTGVIGLGLDMTETVRTRKDLGESEERFRAVFEHSPIGIGIAVRGMLRYANPAFLGLFRVGQPSDVVGRSVLDYVAPRCRAELHRRIEDRERGKPWSNTFETVGVRADGTEFDYHVEVARIRLPDADATLAFVGDVTDRNRAQEDLERRVRERTAELHGVNAQLRSEIAERIRSEADLKLFREIVAHASDAISVSDGQGVCVYQNSAHEALVGFSDREREGKSPSLYIPNFRAYLQEIEVRGSWSGQVLHRTKHGESRTLECSAFAVRKEDGSTLCYVAIKRDITERLRAQEETQRAVQEKLQAFEELKLAQGQLIRSEKLASIGMLVAGVAHEINNPLNVIYGNLKLIQEGALARGRKKRPRRTGARAPSPAAELRKTRSMLRDALRAAERARDIIKTFRDFARDSRLAEAADLNACLRKTAALLRRQIPSSITLVRHLEALPRVPCFPGQMSQVFLNLIQNAVEAIEGKGTIVLRSKRENRHVVVEVEDTGKGMSPELKERIFEPFFTTKAVGQGLGLGLAVSAMIVQNHGGEIQVESAPGRGSVFQVRLPLGDSR
jgi:PAS domain S-box-containing protein